MELDKLKAAIFDMDGTLIDSMWIWHQVDVDFMGRYGLQAPENFLLDIEGMSFMETACYYMEKFPQLPHDTPEEIRDEWMDMAVDKYRHEVTLKPGAMEFLDALRERGIPMGIATSNLRELADMVLEILGVRDYFSSLRTSGEVNAGKPDPAVFLKVAEDLGVSPCDCLVFEDVPKGLEGGRNAGMRVCAVKDAFSDFLWEEKKAMADLYLTDYRELLPV